MTAHADAVFKMRSDEEVMKYLDRPRAKSVQEAEAFILSITSNLQQNEAITWGIFRKNALDQLVGSIGFWRIQKEHYRAEIGYMLQKEDQGKGLMQEALNVVVHFGFSEMKLHTVEAQVNPGNAASIKLLEQQGFVQEGFFRENYFYNGHFLNTSVYSLLAPQ